MGSFLEPRLFHHRALARELLLVAGFVRFRDYSVIDLMHQEFGLAIRGVQSEQDARHMIWVLQRFFPDWTHCVLPCKNLPGNTGWVVIIRRNEEISIAF